MIEIIKENGIPVDKRNIPVNLKVVGDPDGNEKIYIEDYIETFIKQIAAKDDIPKVLILYGETQKDENVVNHFIYGAIMAEELKEEKKTVFAENIWKEVNRKAGHFFPEAQIMGWAYIRYDLAEFAQEKQLLTHKQFFRPEQKIFLEYSGFDKKAQIFFCEKDKLVKQDGHYVYYESNEAMQNYMVTIKQDEPLEVQPEVDRAAQKCRGLVREKKEEIKHKQTMGMLYGTSMAMLLVVTIVGVSLLNNYSKMQNMEKVLYDISNQMAESDAKESKNAEPEKAMVNQTDAPDLLQIEETDVEVVSNIDEPVIVDNAPNDIEPLVDEMEGDEAISDETISEIGEGSDASGLEEEKMQISDLNDAKVDNNGHTYIIEKGDTLSTISVRFYGDESKVDLICELNHIENRDAICYGDNIVLP